MPRESVLASRPGQETQVSVAPSIAGATTQPIDLSPVLPTTQPTLNEQVNVAQAQQPAPQQELQQQGVDPFNKTGANNNEAQNFKLQGLGGGGQQQQSAEPRIDLVILVRRESAPSTQPTAAEPATQQQIQKAP